MSRARNEGQPRTTVASATEGFVYAAFISYSRTDKVIAERFQRSLERFHIPRTIRRQSEGSSRVPRRMVPVFRDISDGRVSPDLEEAVCDAMDKSAFLIVLCSQASATSKWVGREIEHFVSSGRSDRIIPVLVDGEPATQRPTEPHGAVHPLLPLPKSGGAPLMPDLRDAGDGLQYTTLKVVAAMLDVAPHELSQRVTEQETRSRRRAYAVASLFFGLALFAGVAAWFAIERERTALARQSELLGDRSIAAIAQEWPDLALAMSLEALPLRSRWLLPEPDSLAARISSFRSARRLNMSHFIVGHGNLISDCVFSPDGRQIATVSHDGTTRLWSVETGKSVGSFPGFDAVGYIDGGASIVVGDRQGTARIFPADGPDTAVSYVPTGVAPSSSAVATFDLGDTFVVGGWQGGLTAWNISDPDNPTSLPPLDSNISTLQFSSNGARLLAAQDSMIGDRVAGIYDLAEKKLIWSFTCDECAINSAALSPDGTEVVVLPGGANAEIRKVETNALELILTGPDGENLDAVAWHPSGDLIAVSSARGLVAVYARDDGKQVWSRVGHGRNEVSAFPVGIAFAPEADALLSAAYDGTFRAWDTMTGHALYGLSTGGVGFTAMCTDRETNNVALGSENGVLRVWAVSEIARPQRIYRDGAPLRQSVFLPGRKAVFSVDGSRGEILELADGTVSQCGDDWPSDVGWLTSDDSGNFLAFLDADKRLFVADVSQDCAVSSFPEFRSPPFGPFGIGFAMTGERLIVAGDGLEIFNVENGVRVANIGTPDVVNPKLSLSASYAAISVTAGDQIVHDTEAGAEIARFGEDVTGGSNVVLSPSGRYVVFPVVWSGENAPKTKVWDSLSQSFLPDWPHGPAAFVSELVFSPDEKLLAAATYNRSIRIYDLETGEISMSLRGHGADVWKLWMGPERRFLLSLDTDGVLMAWDLRHGLAVEQINYRPLVPRERSFEISAADAGLARHAASIVDILPGAEPGQWYILENDGHANRLTRLNLPASSDLGLSVVCTTVPLGLPGLGLGQVFSGYTEFGEVSPCDE